MSIITKIKPWTPKNLSGCALYLDSSMGITLSSGYVSQWADQSGNGRHASQSTASYRPEYVIDPKTNTWSGALSPSGTPPGGRYYHTAVMYSNYMYVFGGYNGSSNYNDLHRLNLDTLTWSGALSPSGTPPSARQGHIAVVYGNYMYVFGGYNGSSALNDLHRLNLDTLTWSGALSPSGTPPGARYALPAVVYGNYMYVFGGYNGSSALNDLHRLNLDTLTWSGALSPSGTPPGARYALPAVVYGNYMYVFGGYDNSSRLNELHRLNLDTLTWSGALSPSGTPPSARSAHTAVIYGNYTYIFGGYNGSSYLNDLHRTDLSTIISVFRGRPALRFDGSDDYLLRADIGTAGWGSVTIFLVFQNIVTKTSGSGMAIGLYKSSSNRWGIGTHAGPVSNRLGWAGTDSNKGLGDYAHADLTPYVRTAVKNGSAWYSYINGTAQGTGASDDTSSLSSNSSCGIGAEYPGGPTYLTNSDILFVAIYNRALSNTERQKVERWLGARYGITVA